MYGLDAINPAAVHKLESKPDQVVSFMNMKGGIGKTTLAVNITYALAHQHGKQVLVVDCDPQFNATQWLLSDSLTESGRACSIYHT